MEAIQVSLRNAKTLITDVLEAGLVPMVVGSPGIGKSAIGRLLSKELNLELIDHRLSTSEPQDLSGMPNIVDDRAYMVPFTDIFPIEGAEIPKGKDGWMLLLDEATSMSRDVAAAAYKLILDRQVGQYNLHQNCVVVCMGNRKQDNAIVNDLGTALQRRVIHIEVTPNFKEWLEDVAIPKGFDTRVIAYLANQPSKLCDFDPKHKEQTFPCPATWEMMSKLIKDKEIMDSKAALYAGTVGMSTGLQFMNFCKLKEELPDMDLVRKDPMNTPIPADPSIAWVAVTTCADLGSKEDWTPFCDYMDRFRIDQRVLFYTMIFAYNKKLLSDPLFLKRLTAISKWMNS